ncbi:MAG TPA: hypothetical protein PK734_04275 [Bacteroidales bacterium]|nr:hypothetical protein [Bacteroidales bacterium]
MKHFFTLIIAVFIVVLQGCNSKPKVTNESLQGTWTCFEYTISGEGISPQMEAQSKEVALMNSYTFTGDTLTIGNEFFSIGTTFTISSDAKEIMYKAIGYKDVPPGTFVVHDFTGEVLIIQEIQNGITATNFLQKKKE